MSKTECNTIREYYQTTNSFYELRACLISACTWHLRRILGQTRQIFEVIICLLQENLTWHGAKSAKMTSSMRY